MKKNKNLFVSILDFLVGKKILFNGSSPYNGEIVVLQDIFGRYLLASGLTQSGGMIKPLWKKAISKVNSQKVEKILILGLGAGSCLEAIFKKWPRAKITGVEIDPKMIELGKNFFGLSHRNLNIKIEDAADFTAKTQLKFDLILIDLFSGEKYPKFLEEEYFLKNFKKILEKNGLLIFNRLYFEGQKESTNNFSKKLKKYFSLVNSFKFPSFFPTNLLFFCQD
ncbi:hypothetical protein A2Z23_00810 [Candidatus Curtissbacteria bacterium RBG_16_39_7]|uniref:PABS domain-containing protein n=1 Tax=Candidatus Curtissbacteria bacterium RBG_16_39_7 TaxID=1797707 RepID=A0A1F5G1X2_9BACT|nr:MAG: hypothetical protein A2Z23_00810 [Candidatus Curtissbacteria bacterium RBG_16_39_7]